MADDELNDDSDEAQKKKSSQKKVAKHDSGAADLEKVTDYAEDKEISSSDDFSVSLFILLLYCLELWINVKYLTT